MKSQELINKIIKIIEGMSRVKGKRQVFTDWIKIMALEITNVAYKHPNNTVWQDREQEYLEIKRKYSENEWNMFVEMFDILIDGLNKESIDILGRIYMEFGFGNNKTGQYFTPDSVCDLMSKVTEEEIDEFKTQTIYDCCCGSGAMLIHKAKDKNPRQFEIHAQDISWDAVYMCYVQLSLLGYNAIVVQGDSLSEPIVNDPHRIFKTPMHSPYLRNVAMLMNR